MKKDLIDAGQVMARLSHYRHKKTAKKGLEAIRYISTCGTDADVDIMYKLLLLSKDELSKMCDKKIETEEHFVVSVSFILSVQAEDIRRRNAK